MNKNTLAKEIKSAVEWLIRENCGCSTIKLDEKLAVCVGWSEGYDVNVDVPQNIYMLNSNPKNKDGVPIVAQ